METPPDERRVLVIDDDVAVLHSLKFSLEVEGYSVVVSVDGADLFENGIGAPARGCLVVDYDLPRENGLDLLVSLRERGVDWPAILITTSPSPSIRERAKADHIPIVEKPLLGNALLDAIREAFAD